MPIKSLLAGLPKELVTNLQEFFALLDNPKSPHMQTPTAPPMSPAEVLARLQELSAPIRKALQDFLPKPEKNIRLDVYKSFASMLARELKNHDHSLHPDHIYTWISAQKERDERFTETESSQIQRVSRALDEFQLSLQSTYFFDAKKTYRRVDKIYLVMPDKRVRTIESERKVTYEELPQAVNEAFLIRHEPEFTFTII